MESPYLDRFLSHRHNGHGLCILDECCDLEKITQLLQDSVSSRDSCESQQATERWQLLAVGQGPEEEVVHFIIPILAQFSNFSNSEIRMRILIKGVCMCVSCSVTCDSLHPHRLQTTRLLCPWNSPGKNTEMGYHSLAQGIFPTQGFNLGLLHYR